MERRPLGRVHETIPARDGTSRCPARDCAARSPRQADEFFDWVLLRESLALPPIPARRAAARVWREGRYPAFRIPAAIPFTVTTNASCNRSSSSPHRIRRNTSIWTRLIGSTYGFRTLIDLRST